MPGMKASSPQATDELGEKWITPSGEKSKKGQRCWSAGAADPRSRSNVKQTLVRRPVSSAHTHVVPTVPVAMRMEPQIAFIQGKQPLPAAYVAAKVQYNSLCFMSNPDDVKQLPVADHRRNVQLCLCY